MTPAADQLADVLEEIRQIEATPGFEGPRIAKEISQSKIAMSPLGGGPGAYMYLHCWEDHVVGEIGRACETRDWLYSISYDPKPADIREVMIVVNSLIVSRRGDSLALAAALAYRDALKEATP